MLSYKEFFKLFSEDLDSWEKEYVHYSDIPYLSFNPRQIHSDPTGIYFFPKNFKPVSTWKLKPYKFIVNIDDNAKILDFSKVSKEELEKIAEKGNISKEKLDIRIIYGRLQEKFAGSRAGVRQGAASFNKFFRDLGYDALFDDKKIIFFNEVQLVVLNPKILKNVRMERQKFGIYESFKKAISDLEEMGKKYTSDVKTGIIRKKKNNFNKTTEVYCEITFTLDEKYIVLKVYYDENSVKTGEIGVSMMYSNPRLEYGSGSSYSFLNKQWTYGLHNLDQDFKKIFTGTDERI